MQAKCQVDMTYGNISKQLFIFTIPILLSQILQQFYNIADTAIIGKYIGTYALAAIGSTGLLISVIVNFFIGLSTGVSAVIANQFGAHEYDKLKKSIATSLTVSIILGVIFTIASLIFMKPIINLLQTPKDVYDLAVDYLKICFLGITFQLLYNIGTAILRALGNTKDPLYFLVFSCVLNLILDILFIVYFGWGVKGAAIATLISQILATLLVLWKIMCLDDECKIDLKQIKIYKGYTQDIFGVGIPAGLQAIFMSISSLIIQSSINSFGAEAMAGITVFAKVEGFLYFPLFSLGLAVTGFVGQNFGAKEYERVKKGINISLKLSAYLSLIFIIILNIFAPYILKLFTNDVAVIKVGLESIRIVFPSYVLYAMNQIYIGSLRGIEKTFEPMIISLFAHCIFRVIWCYVLLRYFHDMKVIYSSYSVSILIMFGLLYTSYKKNICKKYFKADIVNEN
ncbi:MATE family efflux transporter [Intestinibacter bartlettii]|uniref:MATE family efflux transporter n=1 Tax=Intestinibacter bartlettii TaxID=261299 RepID=A0ABS6DW81_9FIRM|nr:MATE family efflux transporter [Intestinibacter bartlettii]MBU5336100.1 MATE family efflux transporter [Intestinibacter bartlettii]